MSTMIKGSHVLQTSKICFSCVFFLISGANSQCCILKLFAFNKVNSISPLYQTKRKKKNSKQNEMQHKGILINCDSCGRYPAVNLPTLFLKLHKMVTNRERRNFVSRTFFSGTASISRNSNAVGFIVA